MANLTKKQKENKAKIETGARYSILDAINFGERLRNSKI